MLRKLRHEESGDVHFLPLQSGEWTLQGQEKAGKGKSEKEGNRRPGTHT